MYSIEFYSDYAMLSRSPRSLWSYLPGSSTTLYTSTKVLVYITSTGNMLNYPLLTTVGNFCERSKLVTHRVLLGSMLLYTLKKL